MTKNWIGAALAVTLTAATAQAAGVNKTLKITVDETTLHGYVATPPITGWTQIIQYSVVADAAAADQKIAAVVSANSNGATTGLPPRIALTTISLDSGAILTRDYLPAAAQVTAADCNVPPSNTCPNITNFVSVYLAKSLPNRIIVSLTRYLLASIKTVTYVFDPAAGAANRWSLLESQTLPFSGIAGSGLHVTPPDTNTYLFSRTSPTTTAVFQITNK